MGSLGAIAPTILDPPSRGTGGLRFASPQGARPERIRHAVQLTAVVFIPAGSVITAAAASPAWWVVPASAVAFVVGVWVDATWSQHRVWTAHHDEALQASARTWSSTQPWRRGSVPPSGGRAGGGRYDIRSTARSGVVVGRSLAPRGRSDRGVLEACFGVTWVLDVAGKRPAG